MSALHDEQDREFVHTNLHRVCAQGRDCPQCTEATRACLRGLWGWATAPFRWLRFLNVGDWFAIAMVVIVLCRLVVKK